MLTQNNDSLSSLTTIRSLKARARDALRAVVQGAASTWTVTPPVLGGVFARMAPTRGPGPKLDQNVPRIIARGDERC